MWTNLKVKFKILYQKYFWTKEDYWGRLVGLKRKRWESDKDFGKRIEERYKFGR